MNITCNTVSDIIAILTGTSWISDLWTWVSLSIADLLEKEVESEVQEAVNQHFLNMGRIILRSSYHELKVALSFQ